MIHVQRVILTLFLCLAAGPALAQQDTPETPEQVASEMDAGRLQALIDTLDDPERRAIFLERLRTLAELQEAEQEEEETEPQGGLADVLMNAASNGIATLSARIENVLGYLGSAPALFNASVEALSDPESRATVLEIAGKILGVFIGGLIASFVIRRLLARPWSTLQRRTPDNPVNRIVMMAVALVLKLIPLVGFLGVAWVALPLIDPRPDTRTVLLSLVYAHVLAQAIITAAGVVLAIDTPRLRPYTIKDETAAYCYIWIRRITVLTVYGYFINQTLLLVGMDSSGYSLLVDITGGLLLLVLIALVMQNRGQVADAIRGGPEVSGLSGQLRNTLAVLWHLLAIAYLIGVYVVWATEVENGFIYLIWRTVMTLVILAVARLVMRGAQRLLERLFHLPSRLREQYPGLEQRADRYRPVVTRVLNVLIGIIAIVAVLQAWGFDAAGFMTTDTGRDLVTRVLRILFIVAVSFLLWEVVSALIERQLNRKAGENRRILTILPLLKNVVRLVIGTISVMIILSEIGMNIGPLLASAGVLGLAVGFGAQTLVRDLISGIFVILEDIIAVGDWVEIGSHSGMVEVMSIRTMQLRDLSGNLRVIPFGEVTTVHKVAGDYSHALIVVGVAYRENTDEVIDLLVQITDEMREDPDWKDKIYEPLEVQGVNELASSSVDIRVRIKCKPLEQWGLRREFLRRAKKVFDEKGIEIPFPHQTLYFGEPKDGNAPPVRIDLGPDKGQDKGNE